MLCVRGFFEAVEEGCAGCGAAETASDKRCLILMNRGVAVQGNNNYLVGLVVSSELGRQSMSNFSSGKCLASASICFAKVP